jgi:hypothetical protein
MVKQGRLDRSRSERPFALLHFRHWVLLYFGLYLRISISYELDDHHPRTRKRFIQQLFDAIVPTYDVLSRALSMGTHVVSGRIYPC